MLPTSYRVPKEQFSRVTKTGFRLFTKNFAWTIQKNDSLHSRLGIVIGKKISKRAVTRNRIKRIVREAFQVKNSSFPFALDLICFVKQNCAEEKSMDIQKEIQELIKQIKTP